VQVGSQVSGNILALYADFNTKVKKGRSWRLSTRLFSRRQWTMRRHAAGGEGGCRDRAGDPGAIQGNLSSAEANIANQRQTW